MEALSSVNGLVVSQRKEWGEILTGFETRNKYAILDTSGADLYFAVEEGGSLILRWFLKALRPFEMGVRTYDHQMALRAVRPFRFYFHRINVYDAQGDLLGSVQRRFALMRRIYDVLDSSGHAMFQLFGPILHPWTFEIKQGD